MEHLRMLSSIFSVLIGSVKRIVLWEQIMLEKEDNVSDVETFSYGFRLGVWLMIESGVPK